MDNPAPKKFAITIEFSTNTTGVFCVSLALLLSLWNNTTLCLSLWNNIHYILFFVKKHHFIFFSVK